MPRVTFLPAGTAVDCDDGETVFSAGRRAGVAIETSCVGQATCGLCRVKVVSGEAHLSAVADADEKHLGNTYFLTKVRLSCQAVVTGGDVTVEVIAKRRKKR